MAADPEREISSPEVFYSSRLKTTLLVLFSVLMVVLGGVMTAANADWGWARPRIRAGRAGNDDLPTLSPNRLELSAGGLTTVTLGRRWSVEWSQCGEFQVWKDPADIGAPMIVVFECTAPTKGGLPLEVAAVLLSGANAALPDTYGMRATELASLLNEYRAAGRQAG